MPDPTNSNRALGISIDEKPGGRATVGVSHEKLADTTDVARWKPFWTDWLDALDAAADT